MIHLMRSVPADKDPELVALVIAGTLATFDVDVSEIIDDAASMERELADRIGARKGAIAALEKEIEANVDEIVKLEASLAEATTVRERLEVARKSSGFPGER